jgi:hypothetical protein
MAGHSTRERALRTERWFPGARWPAASAFVRRDAAGGRVEAARDATQFREETLAEPRRLEQEDGPAEQLDLIIRLAARARSGTRSGMGKPRSRGYRCGILHSP